jgi:hypothetical protein
MRWNWLLGLSLAAAIIAGSTAPERVRADNDKAAAEALFDEARRLMANKRFADACPKLEASQRLDPGVGTMLNLADCYEKNGQTASAWAQFRETISAARKAGSLEREEIARSRAHELEPKLSYLTIVVWQGQDVLVQRDGRTVDAAMLGTPIPVDPGAHEITASAEGKRRWSTTVDVAATPGTTKVAVPILPDESGGDDQGPRPALGEDDGAGARAASDGGSDGSTQRIVAGVVGGVGVVGVVVGSVFGLKASSDWDEAKSDCNPYPKCGPEGAQLGDDASSAATISTIAFVVGGAAIAGGLVLWLTAPDGESSTETAVGIGPGRVLVHGRF